MLRNNFRIAIQNIVRHKLFSLVNIFCLALGLFTFLIIHHYVTTEKDFDKFHVDCNNIYRIHNDHFENTMLAYSGSKTYPAMGPGLKRTFPEIKSFVRFFSLDHAICTYEDKKINETNILLTDNSFFDFFSFKLLNQSDDSILSKPYTVVLTKRTADKYFGNKSPVGKSISLQTDKSILPLLVTGVIEDPPKNSSLRFEFLISYTTLYNMFGKEAAETSWRRLDYITYLKLQPDVDAISLEHKFPEFIASNIQNTFLNNVNTNEKDIVTLEPLKSIHLNSEPALPFEISGNGQAVRTLTIVSFFILFLSWFNYINLATAIAIKRAKEVGVRKAIGATRAQLLTQFFVECLFLNILAILIAAILYVLISPMFFRFFEIDTISSANLILHGNFWLKMLMLIISGTVISGLYPASVISSFNPVIALKGSIKYNGAPALRRVLISLQFAASTALCICSFIIFKQIRFMRDSNLGIEVENVLILDAPAVKDGGSIYQSKIKSFKSKVFSIPSVEKVTFASTMPGKPLHQFGSLIRRIESESSDVHNFKLARIDDEYFGIFKNDFVAGQNFSERSSAIYHSVIINETACRLLGFKDESDAINRLIIFPGDSGPEERRIVGVIRNYNHFSLKSGYDPLIFSYGVNDHVGYFGIKFGGNVSSNENEFYTGNRESLHKIKTAWLQNFPGNPIKQSLLEEGLDRQYIKEHQLQMLISFFSCFAIVIALVGFISLASFGISQRLKELAVRKILGANNFRIIILITKKYLLPIIIGSLIALPVSWYYISQWLEDYAFRVNLDFYLLGIPVLIIISLTCILIAYQSLTIMGRNPSKYLRIE